jgi:hypothetical protein
MVCIGAIHVVGDDRATRFWHDVWLGDVPLRVSFPTLFWVALFSDASVVANDVTDSHSWDVKFKRSFGVSDMACWERLFALLDPVFLYDQSDRVRWAFERNWEYTSRYMYRWLAFRGISDPQLRKIWKLKVPMKIIFFL